jgi:Zinc finger, C2H2 type
MGFFCDNCGVSFKRQENLEYHIDKKSCHGKKHYCEHCDKGFTTKNSMYRHIKHTCKKIKKDDDDIKIQLKQLMERNKELEQRMTKMEKTTKTPPSTLVQDSTININNDNRVTNNITIVAYGQEDMSHIDREDIIKALKTGFNSTKRLTEVVHFNPKYPKYSNIRRSNFNMKNKVMYHNGSNWMTTTDPHMIDDLYNRKRDFIEENIEDYHDSLTKGDLNKLQRWMNIEDDDHRIRKIKDELREILFNKKEVSETNEKNTSIVDVDIIEDIDEIESCDTYILIKAEKVRKKTVKTRRIAPRNGRYRKSKK